MCTGKASDEGMWADTPALPLSIMMASHLSSTMQYAEKQNKGKDLKNRCKYRVYAYDNRLIENAFTLETITLKDSLLSRVKRVKWVIKCYRGSEREDNWRALLRKNSRG